MENKTTTFVVRLGWVRFRQGVLDPKGDAVSYDRLVCTCCVCPSMSTAGLTMCIVHSTCTEWALCNSCCICFGLLMGLLT